MEVQQNDVIQIMKRIILIISVYHKEDTNMQHYVDRRQNLPEFMLPPYFMSPW